MDINNKVTRTLICKNKKGIVSLKHIDGWVIKQFNSKDNNTQYEEFQEACSKCGGYGELTAFTHVEGGVCFKCMGSGKGRLRKKLIIPSTRELYMAKQTIKEQEDLREKLIREEAYNRTLREAKRETKFYDNDVMYVAYGINTYDVKDELKAQGFIWNPIINKWMSKNNKVTNIEGLKLKEITLWDIYDLNEYNVVWTNDDKITTLYKL